MSSILWADGFKRDESDSLCWQTSSNVSIRDIRLSLEEPIGVVEGVCRKSPVKGKGEEKRRMSLKKARGEDRRAAKSVAYKDLFEKEVHLKAESVLTN